MDFNNVDARANLIELFKKASNDPASLNLAQNALGEFMAAEAAAARFAAAEAVACQFLNVAEATVGAAAVDAAAKGHFDTPPKGTR